MGTHLSEGKSSRTSIGSPEIFLKRRRKGLEGGAVVDRVSEVRTSDGEQQEEQIE